jgi:hypothetical protein
MNMLSQIPCFWKKWSKNENFDIAKSRHNCLKYERVLKILYFHILNIAEFGYIYLEGTCFHKGKKFLILISFDMDSHKKSFW